MGYIVYILVLGVYMTQRVNISLTDDFHERLQVFKDSLNVSAICQDALEKVVSLEEAKASAMSKKEATIAKLKQQAKNATEEWFQTGKKDGLEEAPDLNYENFVALEAYKDDCGFFCADEILSSDDFSWMGERADDAECPERLKLTYVEGLVEGILEFWDEVKDEVAA